MKQFFCLGTYTEPILFGTGQVFQGKGKGVSICSFEDGVIQEISVLGQRNPSYICIDETRNKIYTVNEMKEYLGEFGGGVTQIRYDEKGTLCEERTFNTAGTDPCHIALAPNGKFVSIANFASGSVSVFPVDAQGNLQEKKTTYQHKGSSVHPVRQKGPHAHGTVFSEKDNLMLVPDLGIDTVVAYRYDGESVTAVPAENMTVRPGSGPRFGEFSKDHQHFYLINEISSQILHYALQDGAWCALDCIQTLPKDFNGDNICSDLHLSPNEKYLYASNRGHDSIVVYRIEKDGSLCFIQRESCGGKTPRNFCIDNSGGYLLVGNQDSDNITVFSIGTDGTIAQQRQFAFGSPVCIRFFQKTVF